MMKSHNKLKALAAGLIAAAIIAPVQGASAASGKTKVKLNFPSVIILHYISDLTLTFTGDIDTEIDEGGFSASTALGSSATFDAAIKPNLSSPGIPSKVAVTVDNAWAVRGITSSGKIKVSGVIDNANATTAGGSTAKLENLLVTSGKDSGKDITIDTPGLGAATKGGVKFDLDISGVKESGAHTGAEYTITAANP